jgi:hypothetical protein
MAKKRMTSRNVVESVDPMSAFVDMSEEPVEAEEPKVEAPAEEPKVDMSAPQAKEEEPVEVEEEPAPVAAPAPQEAKKVDVLDMLHDTTMAPKTSVLEKNALPLKLQNEPAEKPVAPKEAPNVGTLYDLLEVARQHANGYQKTWDDSIRAYARHMGFPAMASLEDCKSFLAKWGAKLKD